jgi:hypothetical protein
MERIMRKSWLIAGTAVLLFGAGEARLTAQPPQDDPSQAAILEPDTLAALDKMGASLRRLQHFGVHLDTTQETVLTTGQKVQLRGTVDYKVRRPNHLQVDMETDREMRSVYYDGKTLTLDSPELGFYAQTPAPPTIREAVTMAATSYGIEAPLPELFTWGDNPEMKARIKSAFYVGAETIQGQVCDQYAMRQEGMDWQVWIRRDVEALPCKMVLTTTDDPSMPQYTALMTWDTKANYPEADFAFKPSKDSKRIAFQRVPTTTAQID